MPIARALLWRCTDPINVRFFRLSAQQQTDNYPPSFGHSTGKKLKSAYEMKQTFSNLQTVAELDWLFEVSSLWFW